MVSLSTKDQTQGREPIRTALEWESLKTTFSSLAWWPRASSIAPDSRSALGAVPQDFGSPTVPRLHREPLLVTDPPGLGGCQEDFAPGCAVP